MGAYQLARELGSGRIGASAAGLLFGFNGAALSAISYCNLSWTVAWLPWIVLAAELLFRRGPNKKRILVFGAILGIMLVLADPFIIASAALGVLLLAAESLRGARPAQRKRHIAALVLGLAAGLLVVSPFLWALVKYLPVSVRAAGFTAEGTVLWSMHPLLTVNFFLPDAFGDAGAWGANRFWPAAIYPEKGAPILIGSYLGASGLALALAGAWRKAPKRWVLLAWFGVLIALALGRFGPIYPVVAELDWFSALRYPMKWLVPAMLPLSLLGARAIDGLVDQESPQHVRRLFGSVILVTALVAAASISASPPFDGWMSRVAASATAIRLDEFRSRFLFAGLQACVPLAALLIGLLVRRQIGNRKVAVFLVAVLATDLAVANRKLAPMVPATFYDVPPPAVEAILSDSLYQRVYVDPIPDDLRRTTPVETLAELARWQRELLRGYTAASYGLPMALNVDTESVGPDSLHGAEGFGRNGSAS